MRHPERSQNAAQSEHNGPPMDSIGFRQSSSVAVNQNGDATVELLSGPATEEALTNEKDEQVSSASRALLPVGLNQAQCLEPTLHLAGMSSEESTRPGAEMTMANHVPVDQARPDGPDQ